MIDQILESRNYRDKFSCTSPDDAAWGEVGGQGTAPSTTATHVGPGLNPSSQDYTVFPPTVFGQGGSTSEQP